MSFSLKSRSRDVFVKTHCLGFMYATQSNRKYFLMSSILYCFLFAVYGAGEQSSARESRLKVFRVVCVVVVVLQSSSSSSSSSVAFSTTWSLCCEASTNDYINSNNARNEMR